MRYDRGLVTIIFGTQAVLVLAILLVAGAALVAAEIRWPGEVLRIARGVKDIFFEPSRAVTPAPKDQVDRSPKQETTPSEPDPPKAKSDAKFEIEVAPRPVASDKKLHTKRRVSKSKLKRLRPIQFWQEELPMYAYPWPGCNGALTYFEC